MCTCKGVQMRVWGEDLFSWDKMEWEMGGVVTADWWVSTGKKPMWSH